MSVEVIRSALIDPQRFYQPHLSPKVEGEDMSPENIIKLRNVAKIYEMGRVKVHALRGVNFSEREGNLW